MIEFLTHWILNIVTLSIIIVILEILIPKGKTKKFINLISGFILLIAIINPFTGIVNKGIDLKDFQIVDTNMINRKEIEENSKILKEKQTQQITEVYRKKVINQIIETVGEIKGISGVKADVIINDDYKSNNFGYIKRIYLEIRPEEGNKEVKPIVKINRININNQEQKSGENVNSIEISSEIKKNINNKLTKLFEIKEENIIISLQKNRG